MRGNVCERWGGEEWEADLEEIHFFFLCFFLGCVCVVFGLHHLSLFVDFVVLVIAELV